MKGAILMSLKELYYSVLVVSGSDKFNATINDLLLESRYEPIQYVSSINSAKRLFANRSYDCVIINSPLSDGTGVRFAIDASQSKETVALLMVRSDIHDEIYDKVVEHGVFTLPKPTTKSMILIALNWLASARERIRHSQKKTLSIEEKMEEIRIVNKAKWILIRELRMDEPQAHRYIEKQAMDSCCSKKKIAENIIKMYS